MKSANIRVARTALDIKASGARGRALLPSSRFKDSVHAHAAKMPTDRLKRCLNRVSDNSFVLFLETLRPCDKNNADGL